MAEDSLSLKKLICKDIDLEKTKTLEIAYVDHFSNKEISIFYKSITNRVLTVNMSSIFYSVIYDSDKIKDNLKRCAWKELLKKFSLAS